MGPGHFPAERGGWHLDREETKGKASWVCAQEPADWEAVLIGR